MINYQNSCIFISCVFANCKIIIIKKLNYKLRAAIVTGLYKHGIVVGLCGFVAAVAFYTNHPAHFLTKMDSGAFTVNVERKSTFIFCLITGTSDFNLQIGILKTELHYSKMYCS